MNEKQWGGLAFLFAACSLVSICTARLPSAIPDGVQFPDAQITIVIYEAMFAFLTLVCLIATLACFICYLCLVVEDKDEEKE